MTELDRWVVYGDGPMKPYYERNGITIYHGDCREILPRLNEPVGLLLTDPPYGIDYQPARDGRKSGPACWKRGTKVTGDAEKFDPSHLIGYERAILFGANNYADLLPSSAGWIVWDKTPNGVRDGFIYSHAELAWSNVLGRLQKFSVEWDGSSRQGEPFLHPTQKPVSLLRQLIERYSGDGCVLDPYMGSGSTLRAAKDLGRKAIGIEIEERYCEIAAMRLAQDNLFPEGTL